MVTFEEAVGTLTIAAGTNPKIDEAVRVMCREYDRVYKALDHYADLSLFSPAEAHVARIGLRRVDPDEDRPKGDTHE